MLRSLFILGGMKLKQSETKLIIITGMSGAGKTVAVQSFEDMGFYCVDNLPPTLIPKFIELMKDASNTIRRVALVIDLRSREFFDALYEALDTIEREDWLEEHIIFFDARDEVLVTRYKETRRGHPLEVGGLPLTGIQKERAILEELRGRAQKIIDTSELAPKQLREKIHELYSAEGEKVFTVNFVSFGFKYGIPIDADLMFDVRFLPNPFYIEHMRPLTGLDEEVADYVFKWPTTETFNEKLFDMLQFLIPQYKKEGKAQLVVAIGCTGGQHRSVALTEYFTKALADYHAVRKSHRDIEKRKGH